MAEPYVGEIRAFAGNYAPVNWHLCDGTLLSISDNQVLYSLIGTTYGGDGRTTFALPDLRGRVALNQGQGPGLSQYVLGQQTGTESVTLISSQMPSHSHPYMASTAGASSTSPANAVLATPNAVSEGPRVLYSPSSGAGTNVPLDALSIGAAGGNQPHDNMMPSLPLSYIIALNGIYPSQS